MQSGRYGVFATFRMRAYNYHARKDEIAILVELVESVGFAASVVDRDRRISVAVWTGPGKCSCHGRIPLTRERAYSLALIRPLMRDARG